MERHTRCEGPSGPSRPLASRRDTFLCNSGTGARGPLGGAGVKKKKKYRDCSLPVGPQARPGQTQSLTVFSHFWFHIWSPTEAGSPRPSPYSALGACPLGPPGCWEDPRRGTSRTESAVLRRGPVGGRPALGVLSTGDGRPIPSLHPLRGLSAPPLGLLALSLFFRRRLSIQLELERAVKLDRARELSRMFFPDMMSSPKPSWWEKA